jgi:hypothetical protein
MLMRRARGHEGRLVFGHFHVYRRLTVGACEVITLPFLQQENRGIAIKDGEVALFPPEDPHAPGNTSLD